MSDAPSRKAMYAFDPHNLVIIGLDTDDGPEHPLYDPRAFLPLDPYMTANIAKYGVKETIIVLKQSMDDESVRHVVVDGRRRTLMARAVNEERAKGGEAGIKVPGLIEKANTDEKTLSALMVGMNEIREDDTPIQKAHKAQRLIDQGHSQKDAAVIFGVAVQSLRLWLKLLECSEIVKKAVDDGVLPFSAALQLGELSEEKQTEVIAALRERHEAGELIGIGEAAEAAAAADPTAKKAKEKAAASKAPKRADLKAALKVCLEEKGAEWRLVSAVLAFAVGDTDNLKLEIEELDAKAKETIKAIKKACRPKKAKKTRKAKAKGKGKKTKKADKKD